MADELKTLREASLALAGVQKQLALMTGVFALTVVVGLGALGFLYVKAGDLGETAARIETRLASIEGLLTDMRSMSQRTIEDLGRIKGALKIAEADTAPPVANGAPVGGATGSVPAMTLPSGQPQIQR